MKLVFVHGWGSGPFMWKEMIDAFDKHECHIVNLGFLGDEDIQIPDGDFIGIGHSLGGLWLLKHYPERLSGFISIASFDCFYKHVPTQVLNMMKRNIVKDTSEQLKQFWHHAGFDSIGTIKNLKPLKLIEGLTWLSKWHGHLQKNTPVKILACKDDHIVSEQMSINVWNKFNIDWIDEGGHMLPLTQSEWCTTQIKDFLNELE